MNELFEKYQQEIYRNSGNPGPRPAREKRARDLRRLCILGFGCELSSFNSPKWNPISVEFFENLKLMCPMASNFEDGVDLSETSNTSEFN
jgi:hypothetical protein